MSRVTRALLETDIIVSMSNALTKLLTALAKPTTAERSSAEIRADLGKIDMAALGAKVSEIEQARRRLLLTGTDEQLHENGRALADAKLQVERGATLIEELGNLAAAAERREAEEAIAGVVAEATAAKSDHDAALLDLDEAVASANRALELVKQHHERVKALNQKIAAGASPEKRVRIDPLEVIKAGALEKLKGFMR